jgi:2'-5' RNA ligase
MTTSKYRNESPNLQVEGIRDYKINISLPDTVIREVQKFKEEFYNQFGTAKYLSSEAHISLNLFRVESIPEITIKKELEQLISDWKEFDVLISDFGQFSNSRTIFLNTSTGDIINLQNHIRTVLRQRVKVAKKYTQALSKPHITIASDINKDQFDNCWNYYKVKKYTHNLVVNKISVFRVNHSLNEAWPKKVFDVLLKQ